MHIWHKITGTKLFKQNILLVKGYSNIEIFVPYFSAVSVEQLFEQEEQI